MLPLLLLAALSMVARGPHRHARRRDEPERPIEVTQTRAPDDYGLSVKSTNLSLSMVSEQATPRPGLPTPAQSRPQ